MPKSEVQAMPPSPADSDFKLPLAEAAQVEGDLEKLDALEWPGTTVAGTDESEVVWVTWDGDDDPENPQNFSRKKKWLVSSVGIVFTGTVSLNISAYAISQGSMMERLGVSHEVVVLGITLWTLGFGTAPLILAPFSETYGRRLIYIIASFLYALMYLPQALTPNIVGMLIPRVISGICASTAIALVGGTLSDVWSTSERGFPMALFTFAAFASTGLGPVIFGFVEQRWGFRVINMCLFISSTILAILIFWFLEESRATVLLSRKAARLRLETGQDKWQCKSDAERASLKLMVKTSLFRPIRMLFTEPVVFLFSIYLAFLWGVLYGLLESIPYVFGHVYHFSVGQQGLVFATQVVGALAALGVNYWGDRLYHKNFDKRGAEGRIYLSLVGGALVPLGSWFFTWTSRESVFWFVPCIGVAVMFCGMSSIYLSVFNYLVDSYLIYASSALSAQSFMRNIFGAVFPLFSVRMYDRLGVPAAGSLFSGLATLLAFIPFVLFHYGAQIRERSPFAKQLAALEKRVISPGSSQIPDSLLNDPILRAAIAALLPRSYNFEVYKTLWQIRRFSIQRVALQMPEGLLMWACALVDLVEKFTEAEAVVLGDVTYGACCVDDYTAQALGCDMLVHYGHSCLIPIDQTLIRTLYVFVEIEVDRRHLADTVRRNFPACIPESAPFGSPLSGDGDTTRPKAGPSVEISLQDDEDSSTLAFDEGASATTLAVVGTVQFVAAVQSLKEDLENPAYALPPRRLAITSGDDMPGDATIAASRAKFTVTVPQVKPLSPGEILGCTAPKLSPSTDALIYVGDGRFHLESIMIANPSVPAFRYDPYQKRVTREGYDHIQMRQLRGEAVDKASDSLVKRDGQESLGWAIVLGTLGRQGSIAVMNSINSGLAKHSQLPPPVPILLSELSPSKMSLFASHASAFVQTSCPRLSIDWGYAFPRPLLSPYEAKVALGEASGWEGMGKSKGNGHKLEVYPMDFYADDSLGAWTHDMAEMCERLEGKRVDLCRDKENVNSDWRWFELADLDLNGTASKREVEPLYHCL